VKSGGATLAPIRRKLERCKTGKLDYQIMALNGASLDFNVEHELVTKAVHRVRASGVEQ